MNDPRPGRHRDRGHAGETVQPPTATGRRTLLIAPDKFRGSLTAPEVVAAVTTVADRLGWDVVSRPMADGGEGLLDAFGGPNRTSAVTGPHGRHVEARWRHADGVAVIESALASGLDLAGGGSVNDPMAATSRGTGELIADAVLDGARRIIVGLGGSAMTDGGLAAVEAVVDRLDGDRPVDRGVELLVACDVETLFADAARVFAPQKGADPDQVVELTDRLRRVQTHYDDSYGHWLADHGVDLATTPGGGAAGGLGGGLLVLGGQLVPGLRLVAEQVGLDEVLERVDAVVTGEGALDAESFNGKVVGGVVAAALPHGLPVLVIAGTIRADVPDLPSRVTAVDLSERFGEDASWGQTAQCVRSAVEQELERLL
ncbi:glycerate kinase [Janibacter cremeus]|uniref:Glycerate kinase n=1 Tax=Janibacter cremeus TaxID=1285192 RepID=A0A852VLX8_9MICO|nr:glycerate kinase [Janibacter cremeus]NYF96929.1 glycerate kinase [Janibacter cremeus]